jgi:hypothetical protein
MAMNTTITRTIKAVAAEAVAEAEAEAVAEAVGVIASLEGGSRSSTHSAMGSKSHRVERHTPLVPVQIFTVLLIRSFFYYSKYKFSSFSF